MIKERYNKFVELNDYNNTIVNTNIIEYIQKYSYTDMHCIPYDGKYEKPCIKIIYNDNNRLLIEYKKEDFKNRDEDYSKLKNILL